MLNETIQPFVDKVGPSVEALKNMAQLLDGQLKALMAYYGEQTDAADAKRPEDFFGMISSFSTSLQVSTQHSGILHCGNPPSRNAVSKYTTRRSKRTPRNRRSPSRSLRRNLYGYLPCRSH